MDAHNNNTLTPSQLQQLQQLHLQQQNQGHLNLNNQVNFNVYQDESMLGLANFNQEAKTASGDGPMGMGNFTGNAGGASSLSAQYMQELSLARTMNKSQQDEREKELKKRLSSSNDPSSPTMASINQADNLHGLSSPAKRQRLNDANANAAASLDARNRTLQQQFLSHHPQPQQQHPSINTNAGTLPRPPNSPGSWNMGVGAGVPGVGAAGAMMAAQGIPQSLLASEDFAGANAALRRNLASLQQQQQQQPFPNHEGSAVATNAQHNASAGATLPMNMNMNMNMGLLDDSLAGPNANQIWATEMLLRSGGTGQNTANVNPAAAGGESLMQLQLLRQQQARIQQLEQLEEEAVMRRQLQILRQSQANNNVNPNMNMNLNMNMGMGVGMGMGMNPINNMNMNMNPNINMNPMNMNSGPGFDSLRLQQFQQQQQQSNFPQDMQQQQQQQWGMMPPSQSNKPIAQPQDNFGSSMDAMGGSQQHSSSGQGSHGNTRQSSSNAQNRRTSTSSTVSSSIARATPMVGPLAPPVPAPPPTSQPNYQLPPIEEGETKHYDQRVHVPLAIEEDQNWLSEFQCFVRSELLQVFRASQQDVKIRVASKKVYYKQVGIRCKFCAHWKPSTRAIRSSAFPSSIRQLYQSFTMMLRDHFGNCPAIPTPLKERFLQLKRNNTQGASDSMRYWIYSAVKLGMVDSECGIVLNEQTQAASRNKPPFGTSNANGADAIAATQDHPPRLLVKPEDLEQNIISSEFLYTLLTQYQLIRLMSTECIGNRKSLRPGVPGLGCRYCCAAGRMGLSRVFPAKKKQLPTQIQDLYDHIRRCNLCPSAVKDKLNTMKEERDKHRSGSEIAPPAKGNDKEKDRPPRIIDEDDKGFVDLLWQRLGHRGELATPIV